MDYLYESLLQPELYREDRAVAQFVENLLVPDIDIASDEQAERCADTLLPFDDIVGHLDILDNEAQQDFASTQIVQPKFSAFTDLPTPHSLISDIPRKQKNVKNLLSAGKCFALITNSQFIFFTTIVYHWNGFPIINSEKSNEKERKQGILSIGSSVKGNTFVSLVDMQLKGYQIEFKSEDRTIVREGDYDYEFSQFYKIEDEKEMAQIIRKVPKLASKFAHIRERDCLVNFLASLKVLHQFGYTR